jgi:multidrug efflux pump subunit AcrB
MDVRCSAGSSRPSTASSAAPRTATARRRALIAQGIVMVVYAGCRLTGGCSSGAGGFVPAQDKQYLIGFAQLPDGASLDRTER